MAYRRPGTKRITRLADGARCLTSVICTSELVCRALRSEMPRGIEAIQQEVKINESRIGLPFGGDTVHSLIIQRLSEFQPRSQVVARAHVVSGVDVQSSK